mmetsp:Transcript_5589/g.4796  ORF Transcript_5589/g.4796 Transcript_5589/m.4796 type:complete len:94 (-) Transcript_5589:16-297(-)
MYPATIQLSSNEILILGGVDKGTNVTNGGIYKINSSGILELHKRVELSTGDYFRNGLFVNQKEKEIQFYGCLQKHSFNLSTRKFRYSVMSRNF